MKLNRIGARGHPARSAGVALIHPLIVGAIAVLLVNDHVLKGMWPGVATGKLSDFAGLLFFPVLLGATLGRLLPPRMVRPAAYSVTALGFIATQLSPAVAQAAADVLGVIGIPSRITPDPTDLVALVAFVPSYRLWLTADASGQISRRWRMTVIVLGAAASMATSYEWIPTTGQVVWTGEEFVVVMSDMEPGASPYWTSGDGLHWESVTTPGVDALTVIDQTRSEWLIGRCRTGGLLCQKVNPSVLVGFASTTDGGAHWSELGDAIPLAFASTDPEGFLDMWDLRCSVNSFDQDHCTRTVRDPISGNKQIEELLFGASRWVNRQSVDLLPYVDEPRGARRCEIEDTDRCWTRVTKVVSWISKDGGVTWQTGNQEAKNLYNAADHSDSGDVLDLACFEPASSHCFRIYSDQHRSRTIQQTVDGGQTWTEAWAVSPLVDNTQDPVHIAASHDSVVASLGEGGIVTREPAGNWILGSVGGAETKIPTWTSGESMLLGQTAAWVAGMVTLSVLVIATRIRDRASALSYLPALMMLSVSIAVVPALSIATRNYPYTPFNSGWLAGVAIAVGVIYASWIILRVPLTRPRIAYTATTVVMLIAFATFTMRTILQDYAS